MRTLTVLTSRLRTWPPRRVQCLDYSSDHRNNDKAGKKKSARMQTLSPRSAVCRNKSCPGADVTASINNTGAGANTRETNPTVNNTKEKMEKDNRQRNAFPLDWAETKGQGKLKNGPARHPQLRSRSPGFLRRGTQAFRGTG